MCHGRLPSPTGTRPLPIALSCGRRVSQQQQCGAAHHLMKCTLLFPCRTTNPKGVKARNAALPDTSCKRTAAPQQSVRVPCSTQGRHRATGCGRDPAAPCACTGPTALQSHVLLPAQSTTCCIALIDPVNSQVSNTQ